MASHSELLYLNFEPALTDALRSEMKKHFASHPRLSLNAFAKRNSLSEATLRRILKGNLKTSPKYHTVLRVLQAISKSSSPRDWIDRFPGVIAQFVEKNMSIMAMRRASQPSPQVLTELLKDRESYIVYKLAANRSGVSSTQVNRILGLPGILALQRLEARGFIQANENGRYHTNQGAMSLPIEHFIQNFSRTADFIHVLDRKVEEPNLFYNLSESVNERSYREILRIQADAIRKIETIISDPKSEGDIPAFVLTAVDRFER